MPIAALQKLETGLIEWLGWPSWSLRTIEVLTLLVLLASLLQVASDSTSSGSTSERQATSLSTKNPRPSMKFRWFQLQYLSVYLIIMLADWLQGTNMYTLYSSYGVDVGTLFLTGFLSSAVFGTFLGIYVDRWGRKLGCIIFCVLEVKNTLLHIIAWTILYLHAVHGIIYIYCVDCHQYSGACPIHACSYDRSCPWWVIDIAFVLCI